MKDSWDSDLDKILYVGALMQDDAQEWFQDYQKTMNRDPTYRTMDLFEMSAIERFVSKFEYREANTELEELEYKGDIEKFVTKFKWLNGRVGLHGVALRMKLTQNLPYKIQERISYLDEGLPDAAYIAQVLQAGKTRELFEQSMKRKTNPPKPSPNKAPRTHSPKTDQAPKFEKKYGSLKEAIAGTGISQEIVRKRIRDRECVRCGSGGHMALSCHAPAKIAEIEVETEEPEEEENEPEEYTEEDITGCFEE
jgi:hypothetical protein